MINKSLTVRGAQQHGEGYIPMLLDRLAAVDGHAYEWIAVFLLDHPHIATCQPIDMPAIARTRRDGACSSISCGPPPPCWTTSSAPLPNLLFRL
ncbi:hypothetical protein ACFQ3Z_07635 [Streptomyces nogalater]